MTYKIVAGPKTVTIKGGNYQSACNLFADIINAEAKDGWKYISMETITTQENVGCAFNKSVQTVSIYMLIFGKED